MSVLVETTLGDIVVDLFVKERPRCCLNFLKLCKTKYFNFSLFHSVQRNFVAQTGDPTGTGKGGRSIFQSLYGEQARYFEAETHPKIKHLKAGTLSMVNDGNGFHGSQFLFTLRDNLDSLDGSHTVFGEIAEGLDVLQTINEVHCDDESRPYQNIRITHTVIIDDPLPDPNGLEIPDSPERPSEEEVVAFRIEADEEINPDEDVAPEELKKKDEAQEAQHHAQVLEIIGDIPDKDVKPPDNVLFVCKLNAITTSEDLEIIFSRFGQIDSCEIITDFKTKASLQYAFIEFEAAEMCEKAYHKMDNVLIDDRRIHVDFSQSVSKMQYPQFWKRMQDNGYSTNQTGDDIDNEKKETPRDDNRRRGGRRESSDRHHRTSHRRSPSADDRRAPVRRDMRRDDQYESEKNKKKKNKQKESEVRGGKHSKYSRVRRDDDDVSPANHRRHSKDDMMTSHHRDHHRDEHHRSQQRHRADDRHAIRRSPKYESKSKYDDKRRKEQKRKKKYNNSDTGDDSSSYEAEVRCGKHRKRDHDRR